MSRFLSALKVCQLTDGVFCLTEPLIYESDVLRFTINVPVGFQSDGASVPRIPIAYMLFGNRAHHESVIHDFLYRSDSLPPTTRAQADSVFLEGMIERGKPFWTRQIMYRGVRLGGWAAYHKRKVRDSLIVE